MGALTMISTLFGGLRGGCFDYATALVSRQVRLDLFSSLVKQDIAFFDLTKSASPGGTFFFGRMGTFLKTVLQPQCCDFPSRFRTFRMRCREEAERRSGSLGL
ncbi:unnamed protein product [Nippostrongylus brasiliensis]|uniref:ABC transmembrane type-1 domain-containing protein n=1 Tax=Nippostrongylus brasiliensis TaxID=27835 RepID=A0A0N4XI08_NIPBR|nr:unnamed protein product [Nippostrongylus brasiliensis]